MPVGLAMALSNLPQQVVTRGLHGNGDCGVTAGNNRGEPAVAGTKVAVIPRGQCHISWYARGHLVFCSR